MRVRKINIGIKNVKNVLDEFVQTGEAVTRGEKVKKDKGIYFTSFEVFRKALTPKRLELLHIIKTKKPSSINELARLSKRNIKNVVVDVNYLENIGLIEKKGSQNKTKPAINYDRIALEIAI